MEIWRGRNILSEWSTEILCPIYKKCDKTTHTNCKGITLLSITYKIMGSGIKIRTLDGEDNKEFSNYQRGFRRKRSTVHQPIFLISKLLKKRFKYNEKLLNLFVEYKQSCRNK